MANGITTTKWDWIAEPKVPAKRSRIHRVEDVKWNISPTESCQALKDIGANFLRREGSDCLKGRDKMHCLHLFPGEQLIQCCACERTFVDDTTTLEEEGLI